MIIVIGKITVNPGHKDRALSLCLEHVERSRSEPGCIDHRVHQDCENGNKFTFVEHWLDLAALKTHFAVEASQHFVKNLTACLSEPAEMKIYHTEEITL